MFLGWFSHYIHPICYNIFDSIVLFQLTLILYIRMAGHMLLAGKVIKLLDTARRKSLDNFWGTILFGTYFPYSSVPIIFWIIYYLVNFWPVRKYFKLKPVYQPSGGHYKINQIILLFYPRPSLEVKNLNQTRVNLVSSNLEFLNMIFNLLFSFAILFQFSFVLISFKISLARHITYLSWFWFIGILFWLFSI